MFPPRATLLLRRGTEESSWASRPAKPASGRDPQLTGHRW